MGNNSLYPDEGSDEGIHIYVADEQETPELESSGIVTPLPEPIVESVTDNTVDSQVPDKSTMRKAQSGVYQVTYDVFDTIYSMVIEIDENGVYNVISYVHEYSQTKESLGERDIRSAIDFMDVNQDGYEDIVVVTGGTMNEMKALFLWDELLEGFVRVQYEGFEMLSNFELHDGFIRNWVKESYYTRFMQTLIWNGSILVLESEERYELGDDEIVVDE